MSTLTLIHVAISLIGIATGLVVVYGFVSRDADAGVECGVPGVDDFDQRDGVLLSVPWDYAGDRGGGDFAGGAGGGGAGVEEGVGDDVHCYARRLRSF